MSPLDPRDHSSLEALVSAVAVADPGWLLESGTTSLSRRQWLAAKELDGAWVAHSGSGCVVGHLGVRAGRPPVPAPVAPGGTLGIELCRAMVHPRWWGRGVLDLLVTAATSVRRDPDPETWWLTCVADSYAQQRWARLGFALVAPYRFAAGVDARPGVVMVATARGALWSERQ